MPPIRNYQHRPALRTLHYVPPPPSIGRGFHYETHFRNAVMEADDQGQRRLPAFNALRAQRLWPSIRTIRRWRRRRTMEGHFVPYRRTGNTRARILRGSEQVLLATLMAIYPRITAAEINAFMFHASGQNRFYCHSQIYRAQDRLGMSRKRSSTTANQASLPRNIQKRWNYWNLAYPHGIANIRTEDLIDIDEAAVFQETANRGYGKARIVSRCRDDGPYGHSEKTTLLLAISGETPTVNQDAARWLEMWNQGGTTTARFLAFIQRILDDIGPGTPQRRRTFIFDNLGAHRNLLVLQVIYAAGHRVMFRAPYYPVDGPIEYFFNTIQGTLTLSMYNIDSLGAVRNDVRDTIRNTSSFRSYFLHCGHLP